MNFDFGRVALVLVLAVVPIIGIALGMRAPALRSRIPILIGIFAGLIPIFSLYIPKQFLSGPTGMSPRLDQWLIILAGFALLLGIVNVVQNNSRKISRREKGWFFAAVLLIGLLVTRELTDGVLPAELRWKLDFFVYAGLVLFVVVVVRRVWTILD